jgi:hypothetical protein
MKSASASVECPYRLMSGCRCEFRGNDADILQHFVLEHYAPLQARVEEMYNTVIPQGETIVIDDDPSVIDDVIVIDEDGEYVLPRNSNHRKLKTLKKNIHY